jgi:hypothetical protein
VDSLGKDKDAEVDGLPLPLVGCVPCLTHGSRILHIIELLKDDTLYTKIDYSLDDHGEDVGATREGVGPELLNE